MEYCVLVLMVPWTDDVHSWRIHIGGFARSPPALVLSFPPCLFVSWFMSITEAKSSQGMQLPGLNQTGPQEEKKKIDRPRRRRSTNNGWESNEGQPDFDVKAVFFYVQLKA